MDTNQKKETASAWFKSLRDQFCESFEKIDQVGKFERKSWPHKVMNIFICLTETKQEE